MTASPSGSLFFERARAVAPAFTVTDANAGAVAAICGRLAGIPLALELAAARSRFLDPHVLLSRLDEAMTSGGARDLPERQRTLRSTLDWSYGLLTETEQQLFRRFSIFSGGFTLEAVEAVIRSTDRGSSGTDNGGDTINAINGGDVLEPLEVLVEQSLVIVTADAEGRLRYGMLEPIGQYARSLLTERGEACAAGRAHAEFFLDRAERAAPEYMRADQVRWLAWTEADNDNFNAAIEWALANDEPETAGRLGWALWLYWWLRGHLLLGAATWRRHSSAS